MTKSSSDWDALRRRIKNYVNAAIADSWSGGGDPADIELLKALCDVERLKLEAHITKMERSLSTEG